MNKETQLRKLIREELMKEGLWDDVKQTAKDLGSIAKDTIMQKTGYKKFVVSISITYSGDERLNGIRVNQRISSENSKDDVKLKFYEMIDKKFNLKSYEGLSLEIIYTRAPGGYQTADYSAIPLDVAKKISSFLTQTGIFKKTSKTEDDGYQEETFVGEVSLEDVNNLYGMN